MNWFTSTSSITVSTVNPYYLGINILNKPVVSSIEVNNTAISTKALDDQHIEICPSKTWIYCCTNFNLDQILKASILAFFICTPCVSLFCLGIWPKCRKNQKAALVLPTKHCPLKVIQKSIEVLYWGSFIARPKVYWSLLSKFIYWDPWTQFSTRLLLKFSQRLQIPILCVYLIIDAEVA